MQNNPWHSTSQVTKVLEKEKEESEQRRHYFPTDSEDDDEDEKMMQDHDMMSIMEEDDMEGHGQHLSLFGQIIDEKVVHVEVGNASYVTSPDRRVLVFFERVEILFPLTLFVLHCKYIIV